MPDEYDLRDLKFVPVSLQQLTRSVTQVESSETAIPMQRSRERFSMARIAKHLPTRYGWGRLLFRRSERG